MSAADRLTEAHRQAQVRLGAQTVARLAQVWPLLNLEALDATTAAWLTAAQAIIVNQYGASAGLAASYYRTLRAVETGGIAPFTLPPVPPLDKAALRTSLQVTGPVRVKDAMTRGADLAEAGRTARTTSSKSGMRHALNGGRDLILEATRADPKAVGFARATSGGACKFCTMLASRGAVYSEDSASFQSHDGCGCQPVPSFG